MWHLWWVKANLELEDKGSIEEKYLSFAGWNKVIDTPTLRVVGLDGDVSWYWRANGDQTVILMIMVKEP